MTLLFKMAFRNVLRNKKRSLVTLLAVAFGMATMMFLWSYNDSTLMDMKKNTINYITGHIQIQPLHYSENLSPGMGMENPGEIIQKIIDIPGIEAVTSRIKIQGLASYEENAQGALVVGLDAAREMKVTGIAEKIKKGNFLSGRAREVIIGDRLAKKLKVNTGNKIVLMAQDAYGMSMGYAFTVVGIYHFGNRASDERFAYADLKSIQELVDNGGKVTEIVVRLSKEEDLSRVTTLIKSRINLPETQVLTWSQIAPDIEQWIGWGNAVFSIVMIVMTFVVAMGIMNSILMSIFERTKEFGVMLAIGAKPLQLSALVFLETILLEMAGLLVGFLLGWLVIFYFGTFGISLRHLAEAMEMNFMSSVMYTSFNMHRAIDSAKTLFVVSLIVLCYPVLRTSRLKPIKAIYHNDYSA